MVRSVTGQSLESDSSREPRSARSDRKLAFIRVHSRFSSAWIRLRAYGGAIFSARWQPIPWRLRQRKLFRKFLIQINAQTRRLVNEHVAVLHGRQTRKNVLCRLVELNGLLDTKIVNRQVQVRIGGVPHGRNICGSMPGGSHLKPLGQSGDLPSRSQSTHLRNVHTDEID